jgi:ubiquitin-like protein Pup
MPQETAYRPTPTNPTEHADPQAAATTAVQDTDEMLDDIDACLEENALEVVRTYVARGGQ